METPLYNFDGHLDRETYCRRKFEEGVKRYEPLLRWIARNYSRQARTSDEIDDAYQEGLINAWLAFPNFLNAHNIDHKVFFANQMKWGVLGFYRKKSQRMQSMFKEFKDHYEDEYEFDEEVYKKELEVVYNAMEDSIRSMEAEEYLIMEAILSTEMNFSAAFRKLKFSLTQTNYQKLNSCIAVLRYKVDLLLDSDFKSQTNKLGLGDALILIMERMKDALSMNTGITSLDGDTNKYEPYKRFADIIKRAVDEVGYTYKPIAQLSSIDFLKIIMRVKLIAGESPYTNRRLAFIFGLLTKFSLIANNPFKMKDSEKTKPKVKKEIKPQKGAQFYKELVAKLVRRTELALRENSMHSRFYGDFCNEHQVNQATFGNHFENILGDRYDLYLRGQKIKYMKELLAEGVSDIKAAEMLGYSSPASSHYWRLQFKDNKTA